MCGGGGAEIGCETVGGAGLEEMVGCGRVEVEGDGGSGSTWKRDGRRSFAEIVGPLLPWLAAQ